MFWCCFRATPAHAADCRLEAPSTPPGPVTATLKEERQQCTIHQSPVIQEPQQRMVNPTGIASTVSADLDMVVNTGAQAQPSQDRILPDRHLVEIIFRTALLETFPEVPVLPLDQVSLGLMDSLNFQASIAATDTSASPRSKQWRELLRQNTSGGSCQEISSARYASDVPLRRLPPHPLSYRRMEAHSGKVKSASVAPAKRLVSTAGESARGSRSSGLVMCDGMYVCKRAELLLNGIRLGQEARGDAGQVPRRVKSVSVRSGPCDPPLPRTRPLYSGTAGAPQPGLRSKTARSKGVAV